MALTNSLAVLFIAVLLQIFGGNFYSNASCFYAPNSACECVRSFVLPSVQKKIQARVLKFHIWIPRQKIKIAYPCIFSCLNYLPLPSYAPFKG